MKHKQIIDLHNANYMLRPSTGNTGYRTYNVFELESQSGEHPKNYAFMLFNDKIDIFNPQMSALRSGLIYSVKTLQPVFEELDFTPIAFVNTRIQGALFDKAYVDLITQEYDLRKHQDSFTRLKNMTVPQAVEDSQIFTQLYKFILHDDKTNRTKPMPYYITVGGYDNAYHKIVENRIIQTRFIKALQKMRQK